MESHDLVNIIFQSSNKKQSKKKIIQGPKSKSNMNLNQRRFDKDILKQRNTIQASKQQKNNEIFRKAQNKNC